MTATFDGPTHCPKCGEAASSNMIACPATNYELGYHRLMEHVRWSGLGLIVAPGPMFAALDAAYAERDRARAMRTAVAA